MKVRYLIRVVITAGLWLLGAAYLLACDLLARTVAGVVEVPVGIITAAVGGVLLVWILLTGRSG